MVVGDVEGSRVARRGLRTSSRGGGKGDTVGAGWMTVVALQMLVSYKGCGGRGVIV